ncbi:universal stress protein [Streptomyces sp. NPDC007903]|uniref:universal stress protein n=1 Tax=Streptomyces TaxID=1883 RepID=UPI0036EE27C5
MGGDPAAGAVVVGVIDGESQLRVVREAAIEAEHRGCALWFLHAVEWPLPPGSGSESGTNHAERAQRVISPLIEAVSREFPQVHAVSDPISGLPAPALIRRSDEASLVVVGHRGSGGFPRLALGSVSLQVATHARCPVLVIRPADGEQEPGTGRVVVGVEAGDVPAEVMDFAVDAAIRRGARLEVLHAAPGPPFIPVGTAGPVTVDQEALRESARDALDRELGRYQAGFPGLDLRLRVEDGRPATVLTEASRQAVLLVVGSHGRTGFKRLILGSVSGEVLHHASCPVAVVPGVAERLA